MKLCFDCRASFDDQDFRCPACGWQPVKRDGFLSFAPGLLHEQCDFHSEDHEQLFKLECGHFWFQNRNDLIIYALNRYFPTARTFCEIGCGTGFVLMKVANARPELKTVGIELYPNALTFAQSRLPQGEFLQADARQLPYVEEFDVVAALDVLEHLDEDELVLRNMWQCLKPGGSVMITVPAHNWLWSTHDEMACHKRRYSNSELRSKIEKAGFRLIRMTSFVSFLLPLMFISRVISRWGEGRENQEPVQEFQLSKRLNLVLGGICAVERVLIRRGINFTYGGSLLCIAQKG